MIRVALPMGRTGWMGDEDCPGDLCVCGHAREQHEARDWLCAECACASFEFEENATRQRIEDQAADEADDCERDR